jgi:D-alanine-D-alanine ligase-like ATP-grasp enzyme
MTRIGFAYNQKPEVPDRFGLTESEAHRGEDEPHSTRRDAVSRNLQSPVSAFADARLVAPASLSLAADDRFAEWDSPKTINAVADALSLHGDVIRLEATLDFPERLRDAAPDIVFNIAEGLHGVNRESHVPAICEFYDIPYSGSDPFTLSLCLDKAHTK